MLKYFLPLLLIFLLLPAEASSGEMVDIHRGTLRVLTLDDRPPNSMMLKQLGAIAGVYLDVDYGWEPDISTVQYDLLSLNAAVAGSLVGSRTTLPFDLEPPLLHEKALVHFAFPRAQPTVTGADTRKVYDKILARLKEIDVQRKVIDFLKGKIVSTGEIALDDYAARINGWLNFLQRCDIDPDRFLITLDDNRPGPLADWLKLELSEYSNHVTDGTDEGMMLLLGRYLREKQPDRPTTLGLLWTNPRDLTSIAPLESALVAENFLSELKWLKLRTTPLLDNVEEWRPVLWINGTGASDAMDDYFIQESSQVRVGDRRVIVADTAVLNGADPVLIEIWRDVGPPPNLIGYLGWNTSSNTLGSALALWVTVDYGYSTRPDPAIVESATDLFLWSRLLDDWLYQTLVREDVRAEFKWGGANIWDLTDEEAYLAADEIAHQLAKLWEDLGVDISTPLRVVDPFYETGFIVELPWNRFFEIKISPIDRREWLPVIIELPSPSRESQK